ncbi:MAG: glycosyltransferase, partial [Pseudomonadota bacterium]
VVLDAVLRRRGGLRLTRRLARRADQVTLILPDLTGRPLRALLTLCAVLLCLGAQPLLRRDTAPGETGPVRRSDRLTPHTLATMLPPDTPWNIRRDCALLAAAVLHPVLGGVAIRPPPVPARIRTLNGAARDGPAGLTRLMLHVWHARKLGARFPLATATDVARYRRWFVAQEAPRLHPFALPAALTAEGAARGAGFAAVDAGRVAAVARQIADALAGRGIDPWLAAPLGDAAGALDRMALAHALMANLSLEGEAVPPWRSGRIAAWVRDGPFGTPTADGHALTVSGHADDETGLARNAAMTRDALREAGVATRSGTQVTAGRRLARAVCLHHCNADRIPQRVAAMPPEAVQIGFLLWELDRLPDAHRLALDVLDEIWVPSRFVQRSYAAATDTPVRLMRKGLPEPRACPVELTHFGARAGRFTALTCFDVHSSVERKNPMAAVRAFRAAFPERDAPVQLIVKSTPPVAGHWGDPRDQIGQIRAIARRDPRIVLVEEMLPFDRFLGLIAAADCLISPHRAEGFGYLPAYAMQLGTPVLASDWGVSRRSPASTCTRRWSV